jgi:hypothetical protein
VEVKMRCVRCTLDSTSRQINRRRRDSLLQAKRQ